MRLGILIFSEPALEQYAQADRIEQAARARGHEVVKLYSPFLSFIHDQTGLRIFHQNQPLPALDVVVSRPNYLEEPSLHMHVTSLLKEAGLRILNGADDVWVTKNKLAQHFLFLKAGIPMPRWAIVRSPEQAYDAQRQIGLPVILKTAFGTQGKGIFYADSTETFYPVVDYLNVRDKNPIIIEEFIREADRKDIRAFVVNGNIVAAMERTARPGDVRSNASIGGTGSAVTLTDEERELSLQVARLFSLDIAGVDLLRSNRGPLVIEVNANPGFKELERVTGIDVASAIVEAAEQQARATA